MNKRNFREMLQAQWGKGNFVCVGLDSDIHEIPETSMRYDRDHPDIEESIVEFNRRIVLATHDLVCAYKPNSAFYEAHGAEGFRALKRTIVNIHAIAPNVPVILDAKRADIGNTNANYVQAAFWSLQADAITVHPYLGAEALQPFLDCKDKGIFVLCRTSNTGSGEFQDMDVSGDMVPHPRYMQLYKYVAHRVANYWNKYGNCGLVVGATYPDQLREIRETVGDMPILIPGIGFQQKDVPLEQQVEQAVNAGKNSRDQGMIINSSRGIIFASKGADFAEAARRETEKLHNLICQYRQNGVKS